MTEETGFDSAAQVETAFYRALESADIGLMERVWAPLDAVTCVHPGQAPLIGRAAVMRSWTDIFFGGPSLRLGVECLQQNCGSGLAFHLVHEHLQLIGHQSRQLPVVATNTYQRIGTHWFMTAHHGSATLAPESAKATPSREPVLH